jgi:predicted phosphodiesterase
MQAAGTQVGMPEVRDVAGFIPMIVPRAASPVGYLGRCHVDDSASRACHRTVGNWARPSMPRLARMVGYPGLPAGTPEVTGPGLTQLPWSNVAGSPGVNPGGKGQVAMVEMYGPAGGEGPARRYGPVGRVAVLSDVHANTPALTAVLAEADGYRPDLVVFCGDLTWGAEPQRTIDLVGALGERAVFLRGNAERAVLELARGVRAAGWPREEWMLAQHSVAAVEFLAGFAFSAVVDVAGLGPIRFCHGSPRSDIELVTPGTPETRFAELVAGIDERVLVTGHTHLQFDRMVAGRRSVNPGSVGLPFHDGMPGTAYWALLGPDVTLCQTRYPISETLQRGASVGDPSAEEIATMLTNPPTPEEIVADAESRVFSD